MATIKESCVVNSSRSSSNENVFRCYRTFDTLGDITIGSASYDFIQAYLVNIL